MMKNILIIIGYFFCASITAQVLDIEGSMIIGESNDTLPAPGTVRYFNNDFEGWDGNEWVSLTFRNGDEIDGDTLNEIQSLVIDSLGVYISKSQDTLSIESFMPKHRVGEFYGGGIVFYTYNNGANGLIVALEELCPYGCPWGPNVPGAISSWDGAANTALIQAVTGLDPNSMAYKCQNYMAGGFSDWYIPSPYEINILYNELYLINKLLEEDGNADTKPLLFVARYWTSYQYGAGTGFFHYMNLGYQGVTDKSFSNQARAIRAF